MVTSKFGNMKDDAYQFEPDDVISVTSILHRLDETTHNLLQLASACSADDEFKSLRPTLQGEVTTLLGYELEQSNEGRSVQFSPMNEHRNWSMIRPLNQTPDAAIYLWQGLSQASLGLPLQAQLNDLLLSVRKVTSPEHAMKTIETYISVASDAATLQINRALCLTRANTLARERKMAVQEELARQACLTEAQRQLQVGELAGIAIVLEAVSHEPACYTMSNAELADISETLKLAQKFYTHPHSMDWLFNARQRVARRDEERLEATRDHVNALLDAVEAEPTGWVKLVYAQEAEQVAKRFGDKQSRRNAIRVMQRIAATEDMGWQTAEFKFIFPKSAIRSELQKYKYAAGWEDALRIFLASRSPSGSYASNLKLAERNSRNSIRSLISRVSFGSHNLPERENEDFSASELVMYEQVSLRTRGNILAAELELMNDKFSFPARLNMASWFVTTLRSGPESATHFADAFHLYLEDRYSDCARLCIPAIEHSARNLLILLDEPIFRTEQGNSPGRFPSMDFYLKALEKNGLDIDWVRALKTTLLSPGMNLRHKFAHGFQLEFSADESALLLRLLGLLCAMPSNTNATVLDKPLSLPRSRLKRKLRVGWMWV